MVLGPLPADPAAREEAAKPEPEQAGLREANAPENFPSFVTRIFSERFLRRIVEEIDEAAVVGLLEIVERAAQEKMKIKLAAKATKFAAGAAIQDGFGDAERTAKTGDDAADGGDFDLRGSIADQIDEALAHAATDWNPPFVGRNTGALKFERFEAAPFEKIFQVAARVGAGFADQAEGAARGRFGNEPVEVRRVLGNEPHPRGVRRHVFWKGDHGLNKRNRVERHPTGGACHAAGRAVAANNRVGVNFFAPAVRGTLDFEDESL